MIKEMFPENFRSWMKENQDRVGIHIMRIIFALLWLSQGMSKVIYRDADMYADNNGFLGDLNWMALTNPIPMVVTILQDILIPNVSLILFLIVFTELFIGISLGLGLFNRLGALTGGVMTIVLWIFTLGWGEWVWTYPLIFFPHVLFFLSGLGKEIGVDRILKEKDYKLFNLLI